MSNVINIRDIVNSMTIEYDQQYDKPVQSDIVKYLFLKKYIKIKIFKLTSLDTSFDRF